MVNYKDIHGSLMKIFKPLMLLGGQIKFCSCTSFVKVSIFFNCLRYCTAAKSILKLLLSVSVYYTFVYFTILKFKGKCRLWKLQKV
jgi:hypothetical protein